MDSQTTNGTREQQTCLQHPCLNPVCWHAGGNGDGGELSGAPADKAPGRGEAGAGDNGSGHSGNGHGTVMLADKGAGLQGQVVKMQLRAPKAGKYDLMLYCISGAPARLGGAASHPGMSWPPG